MVTLSAFEMRHFFYPESAAAPICIAISSCLSGAAVRYDGQSKPMALLSDWSHRGNIHLLPICPEVGAGLPVPRPPVQLVRSNADKSAELRVLGRDDATLDVTAILQNHAQRSATRLQSTPNLCGYIWKSRSPSCGFGSTPIFAAAADDDRTHIDTGWGIEAGRVQSELPWLAHTEESALDTAVALRNFELLCRLVWDARAARSRGVSLALWHAHYAFLRTVLTIADDNALVQHCADERWESYLIALQQGCRKMKAELLLGLFAE